MNAAEFRAWLDRRGWNYTQAAPHLAADHTEVMRWAKGERRIGRRLVRIIELMGDTHSIEMQNVRAWWASMTYDERRGCLMRHDEKSCPCGDGEAPGHPYCWCMPHPAWLPLKEA